MCELCQGKGFYSVPIPPLTMRGIVADRGGVMTAPCPSCNPATIKPDYFFEDGTIPRSSGAIQGIFSDILQFWHVYHVLPDLIEIHPEDLPFLLAWRFALKHGEGTYTAMGVKLQGNDGLRRGAYALK